ncbi:MAG: SGNH/GDSL hydrolase family protein, partial [Planctomycetota bacterium]
MKIAPGYGIRVRRRPGPLLALLVGLSGLSCWCCRSTEGAPGTGLEEGAAAKTGLGSNILRRGGLGNSRIRFERDRKGHVAFMGGSITEMNGYRPMVMRVLGERFPGTKFTFTDAGISSTCSTTGAFRLSRDVLAHGPVDLFFVEFAVNDDQDAAHSRTDCIRGMEGIVRRAREHNPNADVVIVYFLNPGMLRKIMEGGTPLTIESHEKVAARYGVPAINLAKEVADRTGAGTFSWKAYGGTHPKPAGNRVCTEMIEKLLDAERAKPLSTGAKPQPHPMPDEPLDARSYFRGRFADIKRAVIRSGWKVHVPDWRAIGGGFRGRFRDIPVLAADTPGAELTCHFKGTAIGAYVLAGPDAGIVEATVDGNKPRKVDLYHRYSRGLHYPRTVMFEADLSPGAHTLRLRLTGEKNSRS